MKALEIKCCNACVLCLVSAIVMLIIGLCIWGIRPIAELTPTDQYMSYVIMWLGGMSMAFNKARKWTKNQNQ